MRFLAVTWLVALLSMQSDIDAADLEVAPYAAAPEPREPIEVLNSYTESLVGREDSLGGGLVADESGNIVSIQVELSQQSGPMRLRLVCGSISERNAENRSTEVLQRACQKRALREIMKLSQRDRQSPFRAAGANEINWQDSRVRLDPDISATILEARYQFPEAHVSCRLQNDCCSGTGSTFLDSCRVPSESEEAAINACRADGRRPRSDGYTDCLVANDVTVGCRTQDDGSRLCH